MCAHQPCRRQWSIKTWRGDGYHGSGGGGGVGYDGYKFEELVAEIGSILINFELGILDEFINSLRYLKSWSEAGNKTQEERTKELQEAFNLSKKAVKYIKEN